MALKKFQEQHGLLTDGLMTPFGATHDMVDTILAPRVEDLVGNDPGNLKPFVPRTPEIVAKTLKFRPSTTRTSFQDDDSLPTQAEYEAAIELMGAVSQDVDFELANQANRPAIAAEEGDDMLVGSAGDDALNGDGSDEFSQQTAPSGKESLIANDVEPEGVYDSAEISETPVDEQFDVVRERIRSLAPGLTDRQVDGAARAAIATGSDALPDGRMGLYADKYGRDHPDYHQALQKQLRNGDLDTEGLEKILTALTRDYVTAVGNTQRGERTAAVIEVLADQRIADARALGIDLDAEVAREQVARFAAAVTNGEIDTDALGDLLMTALDFVPVVGEAQSAYEAIDIYRQIQEAEAKEPPEDTAALYTDFSLAMMGAVPFLGKGIKAVKLGGRVKGAVDRVKSTKLYKKLDQQVAGRQLLNLTDNGKLDAVSAKGLFDETAWKAFDAKTREAFELSMRVAKKRGSEKRLRDVLDRSALHVPIEEGRLIRYDVEVEPGVWKTRNYDGVAMGKLTKRLGGLIVRKSDDNKTWVYEMKVDAADLSKRQREIDTAVAKPETKVIGRPAKKAKGTLSVFEKDIQYLRMPMYALPKEELIRNVRSMLGKVPKGAADELVERIEVGYEAARQLRRAGRIDLAAKITLGTAIGVSMVGLTEME